MTNKILTIKLDQFKLDSLEKISIKNLRQNGGTLNLTFFQMLDILNRNNHKDNITAYVFDDNNQQIIGYILYYFYNNKEVIHIAHIAIEPNYQKMGYGSSLVKEIIEYYDYKYITADVMYDNFKSKNFFKKLGFNFMPEDKKNRWNIKLEKIV